MLLNSSPHDAFLPPPPFSFSSSSSSSYPGVITIYKSAPLHDLRYSVAKREARLPWLRYDRVYLYIFPTKHTHKFISTDFNTPS